MKSTFSGLNIARSAMIASQVALDVTAQNVANVNTTDYTRQAADLAASGSTGKDKFAPTTVSNLGQGVDVLAVRRMRNAFLDASVRNANSQYMTTDTILAALNDIENIIDETTSDGLNAMLEDFYTSLQDLAKNEGSGYTSMVRAAAQKVTQVMNQYATQLTGIRDEQLSSLQITVDDINTTIDKINKVNAMIKDQTVRGSVSNELLDARDAYLDTLSGYLNITVNAQADGTVSATSTGGVNILEATFSVVATGDQVSVQRTDSDGVTADFTPTNGAVKGYLDILNGAGSLAAAGENGFEGLLYYQRSLDGFAAAIAGTFNEINTVDPASPAPLFSGATAKDIAISAEWLADADYIVVSDQSSKDIVVKMIDAMSEDMAPTLYPGMEGPLGSYGQNLMTQIGINVGYYQDINGMNNSILKATANERESVMGVSIDEEVVNMIKFQKAYQAAARLMTAMDENLDTLINGMGIVGR